MKVAAVVLAAGAGRRLGGQPKQFRELGGHPMLEWSCAIFAEHPAVSELIVVVPPETVEQPPAWLGSYDATVIGGGDTRTDSVGRGLSAIRSADIVAIHDAARPFISAALVSRLFTVAAERGPVIPVLEVTDAIKKVAARDVSIVSTTLNRSELRAAQTPQVFPTALIRGLHDEASVSGQSAPDDAALAELAAVPVHAVPGERWAFKITEPEDLELAEWLVQTGRVRWGGHPA